MTTPRNGLWHPKIEVFETRISSGVLSPLPNWSFETYRRFPLISKMGALIQRTNCNYLIILEIILVSGIIPLALLLFQKRIGSSLKRGPLFVEIRHDNLHKTYTCQKQLGIIPLIERPFNFLTKA